MPLRWIAALLVFALYLSALACAPCAPAQEQSAAERAAAEAADVHFSGEVLPGKEFVHDIGHGLVFGLAPLTGDGGDGWVIDIVPKAQSADDPAEFSEIVTPPYHFYNDRYLAAAYGYSAKEAVQMTTRRFNFVLSESDEQKANDVVNASLYPLTTSDEEKDRIARESASLELGRGEFHITHSHVTLGKGDRPDSIDVLKFDVTITFSSGLTLAQVLAPKRPRTR